MARRERRILIEWLIEIPALRTETYRGTFIRELTTSNSVSRV